MNLVVTCEHGGNRIPAPYRELFVGCETVLASHRGYDEGALALARSVARTFDATLVAATTSRLLVELNRSPGHRAQFSERTRDLAPAEQARIVARYYEPYRREVQARIASALARGTRVLHLSCHTFTPVLNGAVRNADVGLLYDPRRPAERRLCTRWAALLAARLAPLRVRRNYPYRGYDDGLTTALRRRFGDDTYCGVEIEVNQRHVRAGERAWRDLREEIVASLRDLWTSVGTSGQARRPPSSRARGGSDRPVRREPRANRP